MASIGKRSPRAGSPGWDVEGAGSGAGDPATVGVGRGAGGSSTSVSSSPAEDRRGADECGTGSGVGLAGAASVAPLADGGWSGIRPERSRSSTSSNSSWRRPPASTSSHVLGAATVGRSRPRSENGAIVVLFALFWLQSMKTRPSRSSRRITEVTSAGVCRCRACAIVRATPEACSELRLPSSAA